MKESQRMRRNPAIRSAQQGLSLIELMIAMLLGLLVVGAAGGMFLSNKRVYGTSESLGRIQENQRAAFELMSRDLREAGGNPCGSAATVVPQLKNSADEWWLSYMRGLRGYDAGTAAAGTASGTGTAQRVADTDAIDVHLANDGDINVTLHNNPSAEIDVTGNTGIAVNDVLMVCNMEYALIFQVTGLPSATKIAHNGGGGGTVGNCASEFQWEAPCLHPGASGSYGYCFMVTDPTDPTVNTNCNKHSTSPAEVVKLVTSRWYIGNNGRGGRSLYRVYMVNENGTPTADGNPEEIAEGVRSMTIRYRVAGNATHQTAAQVQAAGEWSRVIAARISMTFESTRGALEGNYIEGTANQVLNRVVSNDVALRNREGLQ